MYFENLLDAVFGMRKIFHIVECEICGYDEVYYEDAETKKLAAHVHNAISFKNLIFKYNTSNNIQYF